MSDNRELTAPNVTQLKAATADEWSEIASRSFVPLTTDWIETGFAGTIDHRRVGAVEVSRVDSQPCKVSRTPKLLRQSQSRDDVVIVSLQDSGESWVSQRGREVRLSKHRGCAYVASEEYTLTVPVDSTTYVLQLPTGLIPLPSSRLRELCARSLSTSCASYRLLEMFTHTVFDEAPHLSDSEGYRVGEGAMSLLTAALGALNGEEPKSPSGTALRTIAYRAIQSRGTDPDLTPTSLAGALGVSPRYLHRILAECGEHPAALIREFRLAAAARILRVSGGARTIADIARTCGFGDVSTFNRAFKRHYGLSPSEYRHRPDLGAGSRIA